MKHYYSILFVLLCYALSSCTTSQRVTISGTPGTEIYSPNKKKLAVINETGKAQVELSSEIYYAYLLSRQPNTDQYVPFALDYKYKSYSGTKILKYTGMGITLAGIVPMLAGVIMLCIEGEAALYLGGTAATLLGIPIGMPADFRSSQTQYEYQYEYLSPSSTNQDLHFVPIVDNGIKKVTSSSMAESRSSTSSKSKASSKKQVKTSSSSRTLNDFGKSISGTYVGTGKLKESGDIVETYDKIKIIISRVDKNTVTVDVVESGESFFNENQSCTVKKTDTGYTLSFKDITSAYINIDKTGKLSYKHPSVDIDGDIYTLEISARKQ